MPDVVSSSQSLARRPSSSRCRRKSASKGSASPAIMTVPPEGCAFVDSIVPSIRVHDNQYTRIGPELLGQINVKLLWCPDGVRQSRLWSLPRSLPTSSELPHPRRQLDRPAVDGEPAISVMVNGFRVFVQGRPSPSGLRGRRDRMASPSLTSTTWHSRLAKHSATRGGGTRPAGNAVRPNLSNFSTSRPEQLPTFTILRASFNSGTASAKMPGGMLAFAPALTQAEDVGDNVLSFVGREHEHRHSGVRGRKRNRQGRIGHPGTAASSVKVGAREFSERSSPLPTA